MISQLEAWKVAGKFNNMRSIVMRMQHICDNAAFQEFVDDSPEASMGCMVEETNRLLNEMNRLLEV